MRLFARTGFLTIALMLVFLVASLEAAVISGAVKDEAGNGLAGVMVTAKNAAKGVATTVFTGETGSYRLPVIFEGVYNLKAARLGFKTQEKDDVNVSATAGVPIEFTLSPKADISEDVPGSYWLSLLEDGIKKREFILTCITCHQIDQDFINFKGVRRGEDEWLAAMKKMRAIDPYEIIAPDFNIQEYSEWLNAAMGPQATIPRFKPPAPVTGEASRVIITEYDIPVAGEMLHDTIVDRDGNVWATGFFKDILYKLDPATGKFTLYKAPMSGAQVRAIADDHRGSLWFMLGGGGKIARFDLSQNRITDVYHVGVYGHDLEVDSHGDLWTNEFFADESVVSPRVFRIDAKTGDKTTYFVPPSGLKRSEGLPLPYGLKVDANDIVWGTELAANKLYKLISAVGRVFTYDPPTKNAGLRRFGYDSHGNLWIPEFNAGKLAKFDPATETFKEYDLPMRDVAPYDTEVDRQRDIVYISTAAGDAVMKFDIKTERFTMYPLPTKNAFQRHIVFDAKTGDVWTSYGSLPPKHPKLVRLHFGEE